MASFDIVEDRGARNPAPEGFGEGARRTGGRGGRADRLARAAAALLWTVAGTAFLGLVVALANSGIRPWPVGAFLALLLAAWCYAGAVLASTGHGPRIGGRAA